MTNIDLKPLLDKQRQLIHSLDPEEGSLFLRFLDKTRSDSCRLHALHDLVTGREPCAELVAVFLEFTRLCADASAITH